MPERTSWTFPFEDPRRVSKLGVGTLLVFASLAIPVIPLFFLAGYCLRVSQRIIHGDGKPALPEWQDWNWLFKHGFRFSEAGLLYALPGLLLFTAGYILVAYPYLVSSLAALLAGGELQMTVEAQAWVHTGLWLSAMATLLSLLGGLFSMPAAMHMVARDSVKAIFKISQWWRILVAAPGAFIRPFLLVTLALFILLVLFTLLTATLVFCLPAALLFSLGTTILSLNASALFASAYRAGLEKSLESPRGGPHV